MTQSPEWKPIEIIVDKNAIIALIEVMFAFGAKHGVQWSAKSEELTTNIGLHYGGVLGYRIEHGRDPEMSKDFASHVAWHDAHTPKEPPHAG